MATSFPLLTILPSLKMQTPVQPEQSQLQPILGLDSRGGQSAPVRGPLSAPIQTPRPIGLQDVQGTAPRRDARIPERFPRGPLPLLTAQGRQKRAGRSTAFAAPPAAVATFSAMTESGTA